MLPSGITARVSIEEASTLGWDRYVGPEGATIGMHTFGSSAPLKDVPVVVMHKDQSYLCRWLGLKQLAAIEPKPGVPPTAPDPATSAPPHGNGQGEHPGTRSRGTPPPTANGKGKGQAPDDAGTPPADNGLGNRP